MKGFQKWWIALVDVFNSVTNGPTSDTSTGLQLPIPQPNSNIRTSPIFRPPSGPEDPSNDFKCDYTAMGKGWNECSTPGNRGCWLRGPGGKEFNISTDYETQVPKGTVRKYYLQTSKMEINADGVVNPFGKVFNKTYPGPWIEACWGDDLEITVKNDLQFNGTTIHWHGLRQLGSMEMDGVNGVTQCPIAPGQTYTYKFRAMQYGTSWYHSHYSLQYGDGLLGPLTIHGPSTSNYDEAKDPILMTDWNHRSAFQDFQQELVGTTGPPKMSSILLNGLGSYAGGARHGLKFNTTFTKGKRYLMRLINTSVDTTFVFAIDHHNITVMSSDFVPIVPYTTDSVLIGIGQRYHVVVEATPLNAAGQPETPRGEYWMRTIPATGCQTFELGGIPDERQGIIYYEKNSEAYPTTPRKNISLACSDEPYNKLVPFIPWTVKPVEKNTIKDLFEVGLQVPAPGKGRPLPTDTFARWAIGSAPLFLNFSNPTIKNLDNVTFNTDYVVIPQNVPRDAWIYLIITATDIGPKDPTRIFVGPAAHPIHLHGHDFALLQQSNTPWNETNFSPKFNNPPRRDVVLLPAGGFVVIAFKADNPGAWLLHCHIAMHASSGLALQILERQEEASRIFRGGKVKQVDEGCKSWNRWFGDERNFWFPEGGVQAFQDDSGI